MRLTLSPLYAAFHPGHGPVCSFFREELSREPPLEFTNEVSSLLEEYE